MILNMIFRDACFVKGGESPFAINFSIKGEHFSYTTNMYRMLTGFNQKCPDGICNVYLTLTERPYDSVSLTQFSLFSSQMLYFVESYSLKHVLTIFLDVCERVSPC